MHESCGFRDLEQACNVRLSFNRPSCPFLTSCLSTCLGIPNFVFRSHNRESQQGKFSSKALPSTTVTGHCAKSENMGRHRSSSRPTRYCSRSPVRRSCQSSYFRHNATQAVHSLYLCPHPLLAALIQEKQSFAIAFREAVRQTFIPGNLTDPIDQTAVRMFLNL